MQDQPRIGLLDRFGHDARHEVDVVPVHAVHQPPREHLVEIAQHAVLAYDELDVGTERTKDAGQFHGDVAAARDQDALRTVLEFEEVV